MEKTFIEENLLYLLLGGGVLIILLIYFFWWRKKKKKQSKQSEEEKRLNEVRKCTKKPQIPCCKENGPDGNTAARRYLFNKCLDKFGAENITYKYPHWFLKKNLI